MEDLNNPIEINGIVVEESIINQWPNTFSNCWINITPKLENLNDYSAELIMSNDFEQGTIIRSNIKYFPNCVAIISWTQDGNITFLWVKEEYRSQGIGYCLSVWLRTWLAINYSIKLNHKLINERNNEAESLLKLFKTTYNDSDIILIDEQ